MTLADLTPDVALAALLKGNVKLRKPTSEEYAVEVYEQAKTPNNGNPEVFITLQWNGSARSRSQRLGIYQGALAVTVYCKLYSDTTANTNIVRQIVEQCQRLIHRKRSERVFFTFNPLNVITPTTPNLSTGYSTTVLNVEWHTKPKF